MHRETERNHKIYKRLFVQELLTRRELFASPWHLWRKFIKTSATKETNNKHTQHRAKKYLKYCFLFHRFLVSYAFYTVLKKKHQRNWNPQLFKATSPDPAASSILPFLATVLRKMSWRKQTEVKPKQASQDFLHLFFSHPVTLSLLLPFVRGVSQALSCSLASVIFFPPMQVPLFINNAPTKWCKLTSPAEFYHPLISHVIY